MSTLGVPRLEALTGIRFFAALSVLMFHLGAYPGAPSFVVTFTNSGYNGVTLFFILSGFILAWNYESTFAKKFSFSDLKSFYVARFARVYPLYLVALAIFVLPTIDSVATVWSYLGNPVFWTHVFSLQAWSSAAVAFGFNAPAWSISVEFFLYATFPILLFFTRFIRQSAKGALILIGASLGVSIAAAVVFAVVDPGAAHYWLYLMPAARLPDFLVGIAIAALVRQTPGAGQSAAGRWWQLFGVIATVGAMCTPALLNSPIGWDAVYIAPFAALIFGLAIAPRTVLGRLLGSRMLVFLGETSFAFYLLHYGFLAWLDPLVGTTPIAFATGAITLLVACLFAAAGAHVLIERPARAGLRRLLDPRRRANLTMALPLNEAPAESSDPDIAARTERDQSPGA